MMRWGLLPHWVKDENGQDQMLILVFVSVMAAMPTVLISLLLETQLAGGSPLLFHL
jgi:ABC-type tungstate transport system substrate-binding protein